MDSNEIDALRSLAEQATSGPWKLCHHLRTDSTCTCGYRGGIWSGDSEHIVCEMGPADSDDLLPRLSVEQNQINAAFIVACDPQTILALCDAARSNSTTTQTPITPPIGVVELPEWINSHFEKLNESGIIQTFHDQSISAGFVALHERLASVEETLKKETALLDRLDLEREDAIDESDPETIRLVGHYWAVQGKCTTVRHAIAALPPSSPEGVQ